MSLTIFGQPCMPLKKRVQPKHRKRLVIGFLSLILSGNIGYVIEELRQRIRKAGNKLTSKQIEDVQAAIRYDENHWRYMRYNECLEAGYPMGTGMIESACGHIVKDRLEVDGARWKTQGAEPVLQLRCIYNGNESSQ